MSLILGVHEGEKLNLNDSVLTVVALSEQKNHIHIELNGKDFLLNEREFVEIAPTVFACVGKIRYDVTRKGENTLPRLAIDAPRSVKITRQRKPITFKPNDHNLYQKAICT